jgi:hypothetical protein
MRLSFTSINAHTKFILLVISINFFAGHVAAQETDAADANTARENVAPVKTDVNTNTNNSAQSNSEANKASTNKKMVQDATISLQTTITGNQEQPKVLYILPWQSPQTESVDFEPLDNQQKAVFNHVERDELRRELETAEELQ